MLNPSESAAEAVAHWPWNGGYSRYSKMFIHHHPQMQSGSRRHRHSLQCTGTYMHCRMAFGLLRHGYCCNFDGLHGITVLMLRMSGACSFIALPA